MEIILFCTAQVDHASLDIRWLILNSRHRIRVPVSRPHLWLSNSSPSPLPSLSSITKIQSSSIGLGRSAADWRCLGRAAARSHIIRRKTVVIHFGSQCPTRQPAQSSVEIHSTLAQPDWKTVVIQFGSELAAQSIGIYPPSKSSRHRIKPLSIAILLK